MRRDFVQQETQYYSKRTTILFVQETTCERDFPESVFSQGTDLSILCKAVNTGKQVPVHLYHKPEIQKARAR